MGVAFFVTYNVLFVFILTNIFLAIINIAYTTMQAEKKEAAEEISFCRSLFYCLISLDNKRPLRKKSIYTSTAEGKALVPYGGEVYLEIFDELYVNSENTVTDMKLWAITCAEEIRSELVQRTGLRKVCQDNV